MALEKIQVNVFMNEYICDECKKGVLRFTGKTKPGIMQNDKLFLHVCTNCKKMFEITNKQYPFQSIEAIDDNNKVTEIFKQYVDKE